MHFIKFFIIPILLISFPFKLYAQSKDLQTTELNKLKTKAQHILIRPGQFANSLDLLPPPPTKNSFLFKNDKNIYRKTRLLKNTPRWEQAIKEAAIFNNTIGNNFSKAIGIEISKKNTPITHDFMEEFISGYFGTDKAKKNYQRIRPFMYFHNHSCTPENENLLRKDGSYPSGHAAFGWSAALILTEILPEKQNEILKTGYEFGQSRVICGAHWQSDVEAGRLIGAEVVARLHADKQFNIKINQVKQEILNKLNHNNPL